MAGPHAGNRNRPAYSGQSRFRFPKQIIELFAPRPPLEFKPPVKRKKLPPMTGIARYVSKFGTLPPIPGSNKKKEEQKKDTSATTNTTTTKYENEKPVESAEKTEKASGVETNTDMDVEGKESDGAAQKEPQEEGGGGGEMDMDMDMDVEEKNEGREMDVEGKPAPGNSKSEKPAESKAKSDNSPTASVATVPFETPARRRLRKHKKKVAKANKLISEGLSKWDPFANSDEKTHDARRTLFVAGFERNLPEARLRCEFEVYGRISKARIPVSKKNGIPCKYGFIEFEKESGMKAALDGCRGRGKKIDGNRLTVDIERARTIEGWTPNRLKQPEKRNSNSSQIVPRPDSRPAPRSRY